MEFIEFPKWKYHRTESALIVASKDEESALGQEWASTPAAFDSAPDAPAPEVVDQPVADPIVEEKPKYKSKGK